MTNSGDGPGAGSVFAEAYTAIQNLYARYNWCSDTGDADGYAACFTEDGELSLPGIGLHRQGRENLREFKRQDKGPGAGTGSAATGTAASGSRRSTRTRCGGGAISTAMTELRERRRS